MKCFTNVSAHQQRGSVLILVLIITSLLATATWSYTDQVDSLVDNTRDEGGALRAEFAAESGMEYAQRRLTLDPYWAGTGPDGFYLPDGVTHFVIDTGIDQNWVDDDKDGHDDPGESEGENEGGNENEGDGECEEDHEHDGCDGDEDEHHHGHDHDCDDDLDDDIDGGHDGGDHSDCDHEGEHDDDHDGCDHDGDEADHDEDGCSHDHDGDGECDHDGHHSDDDGGCDHDHDGDDDCGHDHDNDGHCDHNSNHDADDEDPDDDCDHDDDGADDCGHDHDGDGFCDHDHDGDGFEDDGDVSENQVNLIHVTGAAAGEARAQLGAAVKVYPGESGTSEIALIFLGKNFHMLRTNVMGDALFVDMENKVNDWVFNMAGVGRYEPGGSNHPGNTNLVQSVVDGHVYKYRDDLSPYQDLGDEIVIVDSAVAPAFDLSGFLIPGPGKTIYTGITSLNGVHTEDTAVFILDPGVKLTLTACNFRGGMVVYCPTTYNLRDGYRNRVHLLDGTSIGGGSDGAEANLGLLAPAVKLTSGPNSGYGMTGFSYVNEIGAMKDTFFNGQLVVLNQVSNLKDSTIIYDENVAMAPPQSVGFGTSIGSTDIISLYEDFE